MGDKPVPSMLKKLLTVDAAERWSCKEALESPQGRAGWPCGVGRRHRQDTRVVRERGDR